jgi:6-phosphogluconolactonase
MTTPLSTASQLIFVGTSSRSHGPSRGIYSVRIDLGTGALSAAEVASETPHPGFLALHPGGRLLYASGENGLAGGPATTGAANACAIDPASGRLTLLNQQPTGGLAVTHLAVDASGRMLITVSYHGGQVAAFPIGPDGRLGARTASFATTGRPGPNRERQDRPHPHSVTLSPDNRLACVCDLGLDRIFCYRLDPATATLTPAGEYATTPGAGPRHSKFSADGRFLYVINELDGTIAVHACDPATGTLSQQQVVSTLPAGFTGANTCAEIRLHPNGRFAYGSNRGHDSIAVFTIEAATGALTFVERVPSGGGHPRNFALSPDGAWLVCGNLESNNLASFRVDAATGRLTRTGNTVSVPSPTCVLFCP